ncbi:hypothetical protein Pint_27822 [Pistacia integerrima]|uniref:Uncharacterized protein n=1 Tax=Pistacia integerrima TaxID=434235 RepID=A0ACC0YNA2_9ROSI|nr:hypothetical protein Pint_27822 [Pistacia integerrima]
MPHSCYVPLFPQVVYVFFMLFIVLYLPLCYLSARDKKKRVHYIEIQLDKSYPKSPPSISVDVPCIFRLKWSRDSRLKDLLQQFQEVYKSCPPTSGNDCFIMLCIHANDPKSLPECRFMGSGPTLNSLRKTWQRNSKRWNKDKPFLENVANLLDAELPRPPDYQNSDQQVECGICYAQFLPVDDELGAKSGCGTDYKCDNTSCSRAFHSVCLADWLRSITTTRQSYDVLFGNCPYCSEPVAVKINNTKS